MSKTTSCRSAFTLVELLVVIGIISVLVAMLLPALNKAQQQNKFVMCQSNLRQIGMFLLMYSQEYNGIPFPVGKNRTDKDGYPDGLGTNMPLEERWTTVSFKPHKVNPTIMLCPVDQDIGQLDATDPFLTDKNKDPWLNKHSYILNKHLIYENVRFGRPIHDINGDQIVVLGEKKLDYFDYYMECTFDQKTWVFTTTDYERVEPYRHGLIVGSNQLYLDFHVDRVVQVKRDPSFIDPWQVRVPIPWGGATTRAAIPIKTP